MDLEGPGEPRDRARAPASGAHARLCALAAATVYLGLALWLLRAVLADPSGMLGFPVRPGGQPEAPIGVLDQVMVVTVATRNARVAVSRPWELFGGQLCYPMPRSHTLGEHMLGIGLLAAPGYALTGDPLVSYNAALVLTLWIPALAMYAFARQFTGSPPAAFVAGLLFGFLPVRIGDPAHPFTHGDLWTPLVLLFWYRLMAIGRWRDALGFAAFLGLQLLESFYSVLECSLLLLPFGAWAAWRHRARLTDRLGRIALAAAIVLAIAWLVLWPYLETRATWAILATRASWLNFPVAFWFGGLYYPGSVAFALAVLALIDRVAIGPRLHESFDDPRWAMAAAGGLAFWSALAPVELTPGVELITPLSLLHGILPGVDAVRVPGLVGYGFALACTFLAAYGVAALARGRRGVAIAVGAVAALAALAERMYAPLAIATFRRTTDIEAVAMRPDEDAIALVRSLRGPSVDLPTPHGRKLGVIRGLTDQLLLAAYHGQPTASCYNSFRGPVAAQVSGLVARLPDAGAAEALAALGFENAIAHERFLKPAQRDALARAAGEGAGGGARPLRVVGRAGGVAAYALTPRAPVRSGWDMLAPAEEGGRAVTQVGGGERAQIALAIANRGEATFRQPGPIAPSAVVMRWQPVGGGAAAALESRSRVVLPLALAAGDVLEVVVPADAPVAPGEYAVVLARADAPDAELARARVRVVDGASGGVAGAATSGEGAGGGDDPGGGERR